MTTGASRFLFFSKPFRSCVLGCGGILNTEQECSDPPLTGVLPVDIPRRSQPRASQSLYKRAPPDGLRLPIFPQPLGGALKNRSAAPASPPCVPLFVAMRHLPPAGGSLWPQAAVGSAAFQVLLSAVEVSGKNPCKTKKTAYKKLSLLVRIRGLEPPPSCPD